jgi:hypothetical protein
VNWSRDGGEGIRIPTDDLTVVNKIRCSSRVYVGFTQLPTVRLSAACFWSRAWKPLHSKEQNMRGVPRTGSLTLLVARCNDPLLRTVNKTDVFTRGKGQPSLLSGDIFLLTLSRNRGPSNPNRKNYPCRAERGRTLAMWT